MVVVYGPIKNIYLENYCANNKTIIDCYGEHDVVAWRVAGLATTMWRQRDTVRARVITALDRVGVTR